MAVKRTAKELREAEGGFQGKEDSQFIKLNNFLKNREGKKATQEDIDFINEWNKSSKDLYNEKFKAKIGRAHV